MKFLADQDVYAITTRFLSGLGHDVVLAAQLGLARAEDAELLRVGRDLVTAANQQVTRDWWDDHRHRDCQRNRFSANVELYSHSQCRAATADQNDLPVRGI